MSVQSILRAAKEKSQTYAARNSPFHPQNPATLNQNNNIPVYIPNPTSGDKKLKSEKQSLDALDVFENFSSPPGTIKNKESGELRATASDSNKDITNGTKGSDCDTFAEKLSPTTPLSPTENSAIVSVDGNSFEKDVITPKTGLQSHAVYSDIQDDVSCDPCVDTDLNSFATDKQDSNLESGNETSSNVENSVLDEENTKDISEQGNLPTKTKKRSKRSRPKPEQILQDVHFESDWGEYLNSIKSPQIAEPVVQNNQSQNSVETISRCTLTDQDDFIKLRQFELGTAFESTLELKFVSTNSQSFVSASPTNTENRTSVLDKSTSTDNFAKVFKKAISQSFVSQ